jgi:hypothetical protein
MNSINKKEKELTVKEKEISNKEYHFTRKFAKADKIKEEHKKVLKILS